MQSEIREQTNRPPSLTRRLMKALLRELHRGPVEVCFKEEWEGERKGFFPQNKLKRGQGHVNVYAVDRVLFLLYMLKRAWAVLRVHGV